MWHRSVLSNECSYTTCSNCANGKYQNSEAQTSCKNCASDEVCPEKTAVAGRGTIPRGSVYDSGRDVVVRQHWSCCNGRTCGAVKVGWQDEDGCDCARTHFMPPMLVHW